ncbi:MAG: hypothetical protein IOD15_01815 [Phycisphaerales bacterium]|nr:hypothetical protein [Phycisphaerales bacterium]
MARAGVGVVASGLLLGVGLASAASAQQSFSSFGERSRSFGVSPDGSAMLFQDVGGRLVRFNVASEGQTVVSQTLPFFAADAFSADLSTALGPIFYGNRESPARWRADSGYQQLFGQSGVGYALSGDGSTAVGKWLGTELRAFRWTQTTGLTLLPNLTPPAGATVSGSVAHQVSRDGSTIAGYTQVLTPGLFNRVPTVWRNGTPQALPIPPEANLAFTARLSADGQRIVGATSPDYVFGTEPVARMLFWDAANQYEIINLPDGWRNIEILGGTADLSTVVGTLISASENRGFLWRRDLGFVLADDLLATIGVTRPDWEFNDIRSISDDGRTIVGTARLVIGNPFQEEIAWVATIPTPGAAALLTLAGLWTARRRRGAAGTPNQSPEA